MHWALWLLPALLLLLAPFGWPYGYYTCLRLAVCLAAAAIAVATWELGALWALGLCALALLFNPLIPVRLERETWAPIDIVAGAFMAAHWWFVGRRSSTSLGA